MWGKKTIYHSELRKESPLTLMFTKGVRKTKYEDRNDFAPFKLPDDDEDYTYQIENEACATAIRQAPRNTWLLVSAEGVGKEEARIVIKNPDGSALSKKQKGRAGSSKGPGSVEEGFWQAIELARELRQRYVEEFGEELEPLIKELATSIYINWEKGGWMSLRAGEESHEEPSGDVDPADAMDLETLRKIESLLEKVAIEENIRVKIEALIEDGMNQKTALSTLGYLESLPMADEQEPLE